MKIKEKDRQLYNVYKNEGLKGWFYYQQAKGYRSLLGLDDINIIIYNLVDAYKSDYPDDAYDEKTKTFVKPDLSSVYGTINHKYWKPFFKGLYRTKETATLACDYDKVGFFIKEEGSDKKVIFANSDTGVIDDIDLMRFRKYFKQGTTLDEFSEEIKELDTFIDLSSELRRSVMNHQCDLKLRNTMFNLAATKLVYTASSPEIGYQRACLFIDEYNEAIPNLNLSTDVIDIIIDKEEGKSTSSEGIKKFVKNTTN